MDRTIAGILETPFDILYSTQGIGDKKIQMLNELLQRSIDSDPQLEQEEAVPATAPNPSQASELDKALDSFNHRAVTEGEWARWKTTAARHRLQQIPLGRLASTLSTMTSVIWMTPVGYYLPYSLEELRHLKTHGDKRVRSILEVFYTINLHLANVPSGGHIAVRLDPEFVVSVESALVDLMNQSQVVTNDKIRQTVIIPIVDQLKRDVGEDPYQLVRKRIGLNCEMVGIRDQSESLGLTRARVYQILEECAVAVQARWPRGRLLMNDAIARFTEIGGVEAAVSQLQQLQTLLYPLR